jgi:hypothetical protein
MDAESQAQGLQSWVFQEPIHTHSYMACPFYPWSRALLCANRCTRGRLYRLKVLGPVLTSILYVATGVFVPSSIHTKAVGVSQAAATMVPLWASVTHCPLPRSEIERKSSAGWPARLSVYE